MREAERAEESYSEMLHNTEKNLQVRNPLHYNPNIRQQGNSEGAQIWFRLCRVLTQQVPQNLLFLQQNSHMQALEESLAEAHQLGMESDWQREVLDRLQQVDAEQERKRERLAQLQRQTLAGEERLAYTMREVAGRKVRTEIFFSAVYVYLCRVKN